MVKSMEINETLRKHEKDMPSSSFHYNIYNLYQTKIEFFPFKDDWLIVKFGNAFKDSLLEFLLGSYPDMAQERAGHLGEGHFNQVEPGAMLRCMDIHKATRPCCQVGHGFLGNM